MRTPQLDERSLRAILDANGIDQERVAVIAARGYWLDTYGRKGENDRRFYDDAHFVVAPDLIARFAGNTDPNGWRPGRGSGAEKGMLSLLPGIYYYGTGRHKGQPAFRGCGGLWTVQRDGDPPYLDTGNFAANWHCGGGTEESYGRTSSEGCQTTPPAQWPALRNLLYELLERYRNPIRKNDWNESVRAFPYLLIDETARRAGQLKLTHRTANGQTG